MVTTAFLEQAYLAYFGRPADPNGLAFWTKPGTTEADVLNGFSNSAESIELYGAPTVDPGLLFTQVNAIYGVLFGRVGEIEGVTWWVNQIASGLVNPAGAALAILQGARGSDLTIVDNKLAASHMFTAGLDTTQEVVGYSGSAAADVARAFLASVTTMPATQSDVDAAIVAVVATNNPPPPLTLAVDSPSVIEGNSGDLHQLVFTLTLSAAQATDTVVNFATLNTGTATAGTDFNAAAGAVTFVAGQTTASVTVEVKGDTVYEPNETVKVQFSSVALAAPVTAIGTIINDDILSQTFVLTTGQDIMTGGAGDDKFMATQSTLQLGDVLNGAGGNGDILDVSISGSGIALQGFAAQGIETIRVKSISTDDSTLDLSDTEGVVRLVSDETDGASLTFRDIQNVNSTAIEIIDTKEDHTFIYDTNAYAPNGGLDTVDLTLSEIRDSNGEEDSQGVDIVFKDRNGTASDVDKVVLHSKVNGDAGPTPASSNYVQSLQVGSNFATFMIDGDANLEIENDLDDRVATINAAGLNANLTLDVVTQTSVGTFTYTGAQQRDNLDVTRDGNNVIDLNTGNDDLTVNGNGNQNVIGGEGNDVVRIYATDDKIADGMHNINLGSGNDSLFIVGNVDNYNTKPVDGITTIKAGSGSDYVSISGNGPYQISLDDAANPAGDGADELTKTGAGNNTIEAGGGNDKITINAGEASTANDVKLGGGDDTLNITGNGNQIIDGAEGDDTVDFNGDGDVNADLGAGNDSVTIHDTVDEHGHMNIGVHDIKLGEGNDYLLIDGARISASDNDNSTEDRITKIDAGSGNDTVDVRYDHFLNADLGTGDDRLILRAKDLTTDDLIIGNTGKDTLQLSNESSSEVLLDESDTDSTIGIEVFDLRNQDITLELSAQNFDTTDLNAGGKHEVTVYTREANKTDLPVWAVEAGVTQGMTVQEFTDVANTLYSGSDAANRASLVDALLASGVDVVDFNDQTADGDNTLYTEIGTDPIPVEGVLGTSSEISNVNDKVFFNVEPDGYMAVDITSVPLSLQSNRAFKLEGGNIRDIVIADDDSINGRSTLEFDGPGGVNQSVEDTLIVQNTANIEAADLRNVSGLEIIELRSNDQSSPDRWDIVLTERVINQTTGSADLVIRVATEVPAHSALHITLDPTVHTGALNNVRILTNSNVTVFITDTANGIYDQEVRNDDFGYDYNTTSPYEITVVNQLNFTTDTDNLIGSDGVNDQFFAQTVDQMQASDYANGGVNDFDTLTVAFGVANGNRSLAEQFNGATLDNIEHIKFDTGEVVNMNGIGFGYAPQLEELTSGRSSDTLDNMRKGLTYNLESGDDSLSLLYGFGFTDNVGTTINGGSGEDSVYGSQGFRGVSEEDHISVTGVEYIDLYGNPRGGGEDGDSVTLLEANPVRITIWNAETIIGSSGADLVNADSNGTNPWDSTIYIDGRGGNDDLDVGFGTPTRVTALGGLGDDRIDVLAKDYAQVWGDEGDLKIMDDKVALPVFDGDDTISVHVKGGTGNDMIDIGDDTVYATGHAEVYGQGGSDQITVVGGDMTGPLAEVFVQAWGDRYGRSGQDAADTINVSSGLIAEAYGNGGDDSITASVTTGAYAYGNGGDGADTIGVTVTNSLGAAIAFGMAGDDVITATLNGSGAYGAWVEGGLGNDTITVNNNASSNDQSPQYYFVAGDQVVSDAQFYTGGDLFGDNANNFNADRFYHTAADLVDSEWDYDYNEDTSWTSGTGNEPADVSAAQRHDYTNSDLDNGDGSDEIILGGANEGGNDVITITAVAGQNLAGYIVGGYGNDTISLAGNEDGSDMLVFGDIGYGTLQQETFNSQGLDSITGFNFEDSLPGDPAVDQMDVLNFDAFLGMDAVVTIRTANWADGTINLAPIQIEGREPVYYTDANGANATDISVIVVKDSFVLDDSNFSADPVPATLPVVILEPYDGKIHIADNGRGVVVLARDNDGSGTNMSHFEVYFVQDIDTTAGPTAQTWQIDKVADITSLTLVGLSTVQQNLAQLYDMPV